MTNRCPYSGCKKKRGIISCNFCQKTFCGVHRIVEDHQCVNFDKCIRESFDRNSDKLMNNKCVRDKVKKI